MPGDIREQRAGPCCADVCTNREMVPAKNCEGTRGKVAWPEGRGFLKPLAHDQHFVTSFPFLLSFLPFLCLPLLTLLTLHSLLISFSKILLSLTLDFCRNPDYVHFSPLLEALLKTALLHQIPSCFKESTSPLAIYSTVYDQNHLWG